MYGAFNEIIVKNQISPSRKTKKIGEMTFKDGGKKKNEEKAYPSQTK